MSRMSVSAQKRPIIFLGVGILNTLIDFGFYTLLTTVFLNRSSQIALAGIISGTVALLCAFITHAFITFRGNDVSVRTLVKFGVFTGIGMWGLRPLLLALFIRLEWLYDWAHGVSSSLGLPFTKEFVANTGAFGFMVVIVLLYNYFVYSRYVFNKPAASRTEPGSHSAS